MQPYDVFQKPYYAIATRKINHNQLQTPIALSLFLRNEYLKEKSTISIDLPNDNHLADNERRKSSKNISIVNLVSK
jgi:hypothetical protein